MKNIFFLLIIITISNQLFGQKYDKRYQYDEFVYGLTVPKLKNIKAIANYYKITENEICQFQQHFENSNLAYEKGQIVYLPAGTLLRNTNVAFEALKQFYKPLPIYKIDNSISFPFKDSLVKPMMISDTLIADYLLTDTATFCIYHCSYAIATIDLGGNYLGFILEDSQHLNSEIFIYIYFHNDFLRRIQIGGLWGGDSGHTEKFAIFKDFDNDGISEIVVKSENHTYYFWEENYYHKFDKYENYSMRFQEITYDYNLFKIVDGNYLNVPMDLILTD